MIRRHPDLLPQQYFQTQALPMDFDAVNDFRNYAPSPVGVRLCVLYGDCIKGVLKFQRESFINTSRACTTKQVQHKQGILQLSGFINHNKLSLIKVTQRWLSTGKVNPDFLNL